MTLDTTPPITPFIGDDSTTQFTFDFTCPSADYIKVTLQDRSVTPYVTTVLESYEYTVDLTNSRITYPISGTPLTTTDALIVQRIVPLAQNTDLRSQSGYFPESFESALDYLMMAIQQINATQGQTLIAPYGSTTNIDTFLSEYDAASERIETASAMVASAFFTDVFTSSLASLSIIQGHNGNILLSSPPVSGQLLTLPLISDLTLPYQVAVLLYGGFDAVTVVPSGTNTINGGSSANLSVVGEWAMFVADNTGASAGNWAMIRNSSEFSVPVDTITTTMIQDGAVTADKIGASAVTNAKIGDNAVGTSKIIDANVTTAKLADSAVTNAKLASNAVTNAKIGDNAVGTSKIIDANVTNAKLADSAVTNAKLASSSVTNAKIASNSIGTSNIIDANVTKAKLETSTQNLLTSILQDILGISGALTLTDTHRGKWLNVTAGSTYTITLPEISGVTSPFFFILRRDSGANTITIARSGSDLIDGGTSVSLPATVGSGMLIGADFSGATANQWFTLSFS